MKLDEKEYLKRKEIKEILQTEMDALESKMDILAHAAADTANKFRKARMELKTILKQEKKELVENYNQIKSK